MAEEDDDGIEYEVSYSKHFPLNRWESLFGRKPEPIPCYGSKCHPGLSWCPTCGWTKGVDCPVLEWPHACDGCEQYPKRPAPPEPDPNQLALPFE